ncbi:MAG TPA: sensor domain-containing diguanylate cyclase [Desulfuromonadaceae bacterium]
MPASVDYDNSKVNELKGQVRALNDLIGVAQASVSSIDLDTLLGAILKSAMNFTEMPAGSVALYDNRNGELTLRAHAGLSGAFVARNVWTVAPGGLTDQLLSRDEILFVEDTERADYFNNPLAVQEGIRSLICIPLVTKGSIHGILYLDDFTPRTFDQNRMSLISVLASFAAMAIENAKLHQETRQMAVTDALTGLHNRRYFESVLPQELERARRYGLSLSLLLIDADNFKKFNDTYGHPMGDRILATIGRSIKRVLRSVDFAFRYGGEEFVVILPETAVASACKVAERIRQRIIADSTKVLCRDVAEPVTVSTGIACFPQDAQDAAGLVAVADNLLYQAKGAGKNRILLKEGAKQ